PKPEPADKIVEARVEETVKTQFQPVQKPKAKKDDSAPMCFNCGNQTQRAGSCYVCPACGSTTGCS
ncbi:MAG: hypothetical protein ACREGC_04015, partial [Minisyncoccia bacterium]